MDEITRDMGSMEQQVAMMQPMSEITASMTREIAGISANTGEIENSMLSIGQQMAGTRNNVESIAMTMQAMNAEVQAMSAEMHRMAKPARTLNRMFPFP
jgi:methyl-accepting chemotaxis protein